MVVRRKAKQVKAKASVKRSSAPGTFTAEKRKLFLEAYADGGTVEQACRKAGISRMTISLTTRKDPEFKKQYDAATDMNTDRLEEIVDSMARQERNMVACFFLLKARRPHIYRENMTVTHNASTEIVGAFTAAMGRLTGSAPG